jgi:predicted transcriptional regulator
MSSTPMVPKGTNLNKPNYAQDIANILHLNHAQSDSIIKRIARHSDIPPSTVKGWYEGRKVPTLENFIKLTQAYPELSDWFSQQIQSAENKGKNSSKSASILDIFCLNFETPHLNIDLKAMQKLKLRQLWFYARVLKSEDIGIQDLISNFNVSRATAYRDIEELESFGLMIKNQNDYYIAMLSQN